MRNTVKYELENILGSWSTVKEELATVIKEAMDMAECDIEWYEIYDGGEYFGVDFESEEGEESIAVYVENVGNTWYLTKIR